MPQLTNFRVVQYDKKFKSLRMEVDPSFHGILPRLLVSDDPTVVKKCEGKFRPGRALQCVVVRNDGKNVVLSRKGERPVTLATCLFCVFRYHRFSTRP